MTNNVQHFLMECRGIETRIRAKQNEIAKYREIATGISPNYDGLPHGGSQGSKIENAVLRIAELCEEIEAETAALVSCRRRAKCIIDSVPDPNQRDVLTYRYLNGYGYYLAADKAILEMGAAGPIEMQKAPSGYMQQHPLLSLRKQYYETWRKGLADFGLTPASRARISLEDTGGGGTVKNMNDPMERLLAGGW